MIIAALLLALMVLLVFSIVFNIYYYGRYQSVLANNRHLKEGQENMEEKFSTLSQRFLTQNSQGLIDKNQELLSQLLNPLKEEIKTFKEKAENLHRDQGKESASLRSYIDSLNQTTKVMQNETHNLSKALRGDSKLRGDWGELNLERLLEVAGLKRDTHYKIQPSMRDEDGKIKRPDVVVLMPGKRSVVIDSKLNLAAWSDYTNAINDEEPKEIAAEYFQKHINDMKKHIKELSEKNYQTLTEDHKLDTVFMFVPIEPALLAVLEQNKHLYIDAIEHKVTLVSQSTLLLALKLVAYLWKTEERNLGADKIATQAAKIYDKVAGFFEQMNSIGKHLDSAQDSWQKGIKQLSEGRGNLLDQTKKLKNYGVTPNKEIN